jgi:hypothetical protein
MGEERVALHGLVLALRRSNVSIFSLLEPAAQAVFGPMQEVVANAIVGAIFDLPKAAKTGIV